LLKIGVIIPFLSRIIRRPESFVKGRRGCRTRIQTTKIGEWREGVGVEPTRDVYSPIPDLKSGGITGSLTLPRAELSYSVDHAASRTIDFPVTPLLI
jgi:hypothetical protein